MIVHVGGDGSYLALVDVTQYQGYVHRDWDEDDRLWKHLAQQSDRECILAWSTGLESGWRVAVTEGITDSKGFREFTGVIRNTYDALYLVNFDSLTMAAQFPHRSLPDEETQDHEVPLPAGRYRIRVVQRFDPRSNRRDAPGDEPAFLLEYERWDGEAPRFEQVPWRGGEGA